MFYYDNIKVAPLEPSPWVISGRVTDQTDQSVPNLSVIASTEPDLEANFKEYAGTTSDDGFYTIEVTDTTQPTSLSMAVYTSNYSNYQANNIILSPAVPEQTVNITLANTGNLIGRIVDASGSPVPGANVIAFSPEIPAASKSTSSTANGDFAFIGLDAPGDYFLLADAFGYSAKLIETTFALLQDTTATTQDITLTPAGKISGTVVDPYGNPLEGVVVSARLPDSEDSKNTTTGPDGFYALEDIDVGNDYEVEAIAESYQTSYKVDVQVESRQVTENINFALGIEPAYVTRGYGEKGNYKTDYTFPKGAKEPGANVHRKDTKYNRAYYPRWDTHQWITERAVSILKSDGFDDVVKILNEDAAGHKLGYWIARGVRRADVGYVQKNEGYAREHNHDPWLHTGAYYFLTPRSAADYADKAFEEARAEWMAGLREHPMYLLGLALHHVQDLRVPRHAFGLPDIKSNHKEYENWVEANKTAPQMIASTGTITSFPKLSLPFFGDHSDPNTAFGWVDRSAHVSITYYNQADGSTNVAGVWEPAGDTVPLFRSAQRFSAGFINFFFNSVDTTVPPKPEDQQPWVDDTMEKVKWLFWWDKDNDNVRDPGEETYHYYYDHWNGQLPPMQWNGNCDPHDSVKHENYLETVFWLWDLRHGKRPDQLHLWPWVDSNSIVRVRNLLTGQDITSSYSLGLMVKDLRLKGDRSGYVTPNDVYKRVLTNINVAPIYQSGFDANGIYTNRLKTAKRDILLP